MKLVASMITHNEADRYLPLVVEHLLEFCDEIRVVDDYSTDGTLEFLQARAGVEVSRNRGPSFDEHEGNARNELLRWTLLGGPTYILAIDADEFISDGKAMRQVVEKTPREVYSLTMEEVWTANKSLWIRHDGGWRPRPVPILYAAPKRIDRQWSIPQKKLACGREPSAVRNLYARSRSAASGASVLHFGWTRESERQRRYDRYMKIDAGNFHARQHLLSIMWPAGKVIVKERSWPEGLEPIREELLDVCRSR